MPTITKNNNKKLFSPKAYAFAMRSRGRAHTIGVVGDSFSVVDHKAYQYYKEHSKLANREDVAHYSEHGKLISSFYKIAGEKLIEAKGGIFLEGLGYFGIMQEMKKRAAHDRRNGEIMLNPKTDNIIYNIAYVPIDKENAFKTWVFDYCFTRKIKHNLSKSLKSGNKYSFNASLFFNKLRLTGNDL